ncbi:hypothetical protein ERD78_10615 [Allopusillimonas soli]|uniref:Ubiquinone biosynthesis accessory factor UbiJ n=1 Tax=Allopusillimonas soli TaxID=659016 RepID=A0A853FCD5_9BURK|nr:SCP2 sterol-binding domain-containing protein [Allopusillimonas soli]NYT37597.1 SCP2 sterol-binding domain-containing protein [Allopusillimonas soli]TEA74440.1 hypothetical protein ERD78_10615 [Allopusillimonas soli]
MFSLPTPPGLATLYLGPLNALLRREPWARDRLASHAGKCVRFVAGPLRINLTIQSDGLAGDCDDAVAPDVTLTLPRDSLHSLPGLLRQHDHEALAGLIRLEGDAGLAQVVSDLARMLRWDAEDDLARLVGDVPAARIMAGGRRFTHGVRQAGERLAGNISEYLVEESAMLTSRTAYDAWSQGVHDIQARLDLLDARLARLGPRGRQKEASSAARQARASDGQPGGRAGEGQR